ncbi:LytR/AlgR family response regulator transcription factor [Hufsiella ginkgonis]|uniref:HTH LytTR-type domain-containing protein n=1 Tax=Hufsiella ginkgonis TaxID=2695274 RepID=A0A7K1XSZ7_9SPHI|nr:LytTR family DNA-binding domain-containing protein [Hufsiella ginkgonis]MXV14074.1 hypothetical protein [Hufsiella ginkgonis]
MTKIVIHSQDHLHIINTDDIIFCQSDNGYTDINLAEGEKLTISRSLSRFSDELDESKFIRASQSYLINIDYVKSIDKKKRIIRLFDGAKIPFTGTIKELLGMISRTVMSP